MNIEEHLDRFWNELDEEIKIMAIAACKTVIDGETKKKIFEEYDKDPIYWWAKYHFYWGMYIRNKIRELTKITDDKLPSGNWDDYYIQAVETSLGLREI